VARDPAQAAEWFKRAADQGYARAMLNLGALYEQQAKAGTRSGALPATPPVTSQPATAPTVVPLQTDGTPVARPLPFR
jgi:TPR repeat protein